MKRLLITLLAASVATPALAQQNMPGHNMPGMTMPMPAAKPKPKPAAKAKPAAKKPTAKPVVKKSTAKPAAKKPVAKPAAKKSVPKPAPKPAPDPMAGHDMSAMPPAQSADPMAGHDMSAMAQPAADPPVAPPPAAAFSGPRHAADTVYGEQASAEARKTLRDEHGRIVTSKVMIDRLEAIVRDGRDGYRWDAQGWYGGDINKLWVKSEGEGSFRQSPERAEVQALYNRAINPWFNLQAGVRHDFRPDPQRSHLVLGIQGLAPYWFYVDGALFLSNKGDVTARFEGEYDQRLTQKLILQPRLEFNLAAQDIAELGVGAGLVDAEAGVRLRYQLVPEFAPYIGVEYERAFGDSADFKRAAGDKAAGWSFLVGVRTWF